MNPTVYQVEHNGQTVTVKTTEGPLGVAKGLFRDLTRKASYRVLERFSVTQAPKVTEITEGATRILVTVTDIPLAWVKWCPVRNHPLPYVQP